ncbi:ferroptosis suppressor protein 1-like [Juglans microcarpa x Juglans regia]|uniref:ferroptosis suppressor protein 1-like n=1 Tax=Juglans microcarpa x Juglans regia TaxID=2249226 RepID=UPI001B7DB5BA|nr:ferroptosis suppressor protein 1-like [Juglans microcarpa x Juglans regia]
MKSFDNLEDKSENSYNSAGESPMARAEKEGAKKRVVVVGGGVGGSVLAHSLQSVADVFLIDQKEYYEIPWASLRSMVEPSFAERSVINYSDYLPNVQIITSAATNITDEEVITAGGNTVAYDYLVIATGHSESLPRSREERLNEYRADFEKIKSADSVLIVGGGPTGVELAGEIAVDFPGKKVILVHRGTRLLEFIGPKASRRALAWLVAKKVEVILNQSVNLNFSSDGIFQTSAGETITADCHFVCAGKPVGSSWIKETILSDSLDIHGRLMVDKHLRVRGRNNIFAIGDITDVKEIKQGYLAQSHAQVTAKNIKKLIMGGSEIKMAAYKPGSDMALVSLGRKQGVAQFPIVTISGCIPGLIKSGDLFVGKTRKQLGLKP